MPNESIRDLSMDLEWQSDNLVLGIGNVAFGVFLVIAWAATSLGMIDAWPKVPPGETDMLLIASVSMVLIGAFVVERSRRRIRGLKKNP